ncbi:histone acetyltransferase KAT7-like isoform X3 [Halichondria panicea]|uniref:histone acetyltransferase KAT7-like isoform X3 n=1 Tax=Halichondria panicea TaxID=6063 RepID=UPI00312B6461
MSSSVRQTTGSVQSTPTPPSSGGQSGRSRRSLRKCATPIKSAQKDDHTTHTRTDTGSTNTTLTPPHPKQKAIISSTPARRTIPPTRHKKRRKRIPFTLVEASKGNHCPTPECDGKGHVTGLYSMHYAVSGCPVAAKNKAATITTPVKPLPKTPPPSTSASTDTATASTASTSTERVKPKRKRRRRALVGSRSKRVKQSSGSDDSEVEATTPSEPWRSEVTNEVSPQGPKKRKRIPYTLVEASKGNHCPTPECDGKGHVTGLYSMHYAVSGCPVARGMTPDECVARRDALNRIKLKSLPMEISPTHYLDDKAVRRTSRILSERGVVSLGGPAPLTPGRRSSAPVVSRPQVDRISQLHGLLSNAMPLDYLQHVEPKLEGLTPSLDLSLFREAESKTRLSFGLAEAPANGGGEGLTEAPANSSGEGLAEAPANGGGEGLAEAPANGGGEGLTEAPANGGEYQLKKIEFGQYEIMTWYPSPFPLDHTHLDKLYFCEFCLKYFKSAPILHRHSGDCSWRHPPGNEIYRRGALSVFEIDGDRHKVYCQHLCLLAKLFLESKTLYFDVEPFLFYTLTLADSNGCHILGYFSKEKHSAQSYNLSCIVVLPQHMRKGYGRMLIDFSYLLTRKEQKFGSPERPLSDLGLVSYRSYWKNVILTYILEHEHSGSNISIKGGCRYPAHSSVYIRPPNAEVGMETGVNSDDIVSTLQYYGLLKYWKGKHIILLRKDVLDEHAQRLEAWRQSDVCVDPDCLEWTPIAYPMYT